MNYEKKNSDTIMEKEKLGRRQSNIKKKRNVEGLSN